ncbi:MAG: 16S rRNA (guanine(966)-N(2))-methyltransferase RsmD [Sneathiellales bacterium]|nr:16S rRNA (guanine(966)-N(2))-methyltransferase RsmD [Sneathiellales bacterium]
MRIVGGEFRGKKLQLPEDNRVRPTAERTREALFNILAHGSVYRTEKGPLPFQAKVLDIFAGTGALGIEALSRGAAHVTFIDNHAGSLKLVRQNVAAINAQQKATLLNRDGKKPGKAGHPVDLVLMDPPYSEGLEQPSLHALQEGGWLHEETIIAVEQAVKEKLEIPDGFTELDNRKYGAARLVILKNT